MPAFERGRRGGGCRLKRRRVSLVRHGACHSMVTKQNGGAVWGANRPSSDVVKMIRVVLFIHSHA